MAGLDSIAPRLAPHALTVLGGFHPDGGEGLPKGTETLLLIGPAEPGFWPHFTQSPEWQDGAPDPMDRWSRRVIVRIACDLGGQGAVSLWGPAVPPVFHLGAAHRACLAKPRAPFGA